MSHTRVNRRPARAKELVSPACVLVVVAALSACPPNPSTPDAGLPDDAGASDAGAQSDAGERSALCSSPLPVRSSPDDTRASRGHALLTSDGLGEPLLPRLALDNLWRVWGGPRPADDEAYAAAFQERYGLAPDPAGGQYAAGVPVVDGSHATVTCLYCHADVVAGETVVGAGNGRADLEALYDDLLELSALAQLIGMEVPEPPWDLDGRTGAAGANDAFGLGLELALQHAPAGTSVETELGYQQAPAWWQWRYKGVSYVDGAGSTEGHRTMAAMLLAFGGSLEEVEARDEDLRDVHHAIRAIEPPAWPFEPPADDAVARGLEIYGQRCAQCHGSLCSDEPFPDVIVPLDEVGTDPLRAERFGDDEAALVNASWFGEDHPLTPTNGYLAPPLVGVWASAPYLHNGSVPDLASLLRSSERPTRWRRTGAGRDDYDPSRVGWRYESVSSGGDATTVGGRKIYDTTRPGLSNQGHPFGDDLDDEERADLLELLKSL